MDKYEDLKAYHDCDFLMKVKPDERGDHACAAHMAEGRVFPCNVSNVGHLLKCSDYDGPLLKVLQAKRKCLSLKINA